VPQRFPQVFEKAKNKHDSRRNETKNKKTKKVAPVYYAD